MNTKDTKGTKTTLGRVMRARALEVVTAVALLCAASPASAQQRPNITEDPETVGSGRLLFEAGLDYDKDVKYPLSGLTGDLFSVPNMGVSIGLSSIAELQIDGGIYQKLSIIDRDDEAPLSDVLDVDGDTTSSVRDLVIGTKISCWGKAAPLQIGPCCGTMSFSYPGISFLESDMTAFG